MPYEYKQTEPGLWTVGSYSSGTFESESDHDTSEEAAKRVNYLNGGVDYERIKQIVRDEVFKQLNPK